MKRFGPLVVMLAIFAGVGACISHFHADSRDFQAFEAKRAEWTARCERYRDTPLVTPEALACNADLETLVAEAKRRGWTR